MMNKAVTKVIVPKRSIIRLMKKRYTANKIKIQPQLLSIIGIVLKIGKIIEEMIKVKTILKKE